MNAAGITITPVRVADLLAEGEWMPVYVHIIDHRDARVLVDTGMTDLHPAVADLDPRLRPLSKRTLTSPASTSSSTRTCTLTTAAATTSLPAGRSTSSVGSSTTRATRTTTLSASGSMRRVCGTCRWTASSTCFPGYGSSRHRATLAACTWSSSKLATARSLLAATWRSGWASSTNRTQKAICGCAGSTPSWCGSRTSTSRGDHAPSKASRTFPPNARMNRSAVGTYHGR